VASVESPGEVIGRTSETGAVERLPAAVGDRGAALVLAGEAGIGKTAMLADAAHRAQARGIRALRALVETDGAARAAAAIAELL
jgi:predicted ATP-dependent serine protease